MDLDPQSLLTSLSDATRLRIVYLLARQGELCVCELVAALDSPQPKVWYPIPRAGHNDTYLVGGETYFRRLAAFVADPPGSRQELLV